MCTPWVLLPACGLLLHFANAAPVARRGAAAGLRGRWWSDGSAKGAGGGESSSSLPVGTLTLPGAPPLLCGEFLGWIEAAARQRGKLRLPMQCHLVPGSPLAKTGKAASGWWNRGVLGQLSGVVVR
jgi:hypothetical protein